MRAARRNGLTNDEIKEVLLQTAIYCGVPDANAAFRIACQVLADYDAAAGLPVSRTVICDTAAEGVSGVCVRCNGFGR